MTESWWNFQGRNTFLDLKIIFIFEKLELEWVLWLFISNVWLKGAHTPNKFMDMTPAKGICSIKTEL